MTSHSLSLRGSAARFGAVTAVTLGLLAGAVNAPADAAVTTPGTAVGQASVSIKYTALGDSFSAGSGAGGESGNCVQSPAAYPQLAAVASGVQLRGNLSCFGATTDDVQLTQVPAMSPATDIVTVTVGGNDVGSGSVAGACLPDPSTFSCQSAMAAAGAALLALPVKLTAMFGAIRAEANHARIVVLGYPHLFEPQNMIAADAVNPTAYPAATIAAAVSLNAATDALNGTIEATAAADGATFVDVSRTFAGHGVPSATGGQWINYNPADSTYFGNFHPNALGQQGYAAALAAAVPAL